MQEASAPGATRPLMSDSLLRNSRLVNRTSTMPVVFTKLTMSVSVMVRPIVLKVRPVDISSKKNPRPTVSIAAYSPYLCRSVGDQVARYDVALNLIGAFNDLEHLR